MMIRTEQWRRWSEQEVEPHIEHYTGPQYGDWPDDQLSEMTEEQIIGKMKPYMSRINSNVRGFDDQQRDLVKLAHFCQVLHDMRRGKRGKELAEHEGIGGRINA